MPQDATVGDGNSPDVRRKNMTLTECLPRIWLPAARARNAGEIETPDSDRRC